MQRRKESRGAICPECIVADCNPLPDFPISNAAPRPRKFHLSIRRLATNDSLFVADNNARNPSKREHILDCYPATSLSVSYLLSDVSRSVSSYHPSLVLSAAQCKLTSQPCFLLETSLILKFLPYYIYTERKRNIYSCGNYIFDNSII